MMIDQKKAAITESKKYWGTIENKDVFLYTLVNGLGMKLCVTNFGAAVQSLFVPDVNKALVDVVLGYDELQNYLEDNFYMGTVIGRCANRIAGGKVNIGGESFNLRTKQEGYHHHGGDKGFNQQVWEVKEVRDNSISFRYCSPDGEEGYPGNLETVVTYILDENNCWSILIQATTDAPTLFNPTHHAYFNLEGPLSTTIDHHYLQLYASYFLPVNQTQVPTGEVAEVKGSPFDFTGLKTIDRDINKDDDQLLISNGYDHSWVLETVYSPSLKKAASVYVPSTGIQMNVFTSEPAVHFYSGNFLKVDTGKNDQHYGPRSGLCLETQHFPDAPNHPHFPSIVITPEAPFFSKTVFQFTTRHAL